jgi:hypothetical protein
MEKISHQDIDKDIECHQHENTRKELSGYTIHSLKKRFHPDQHALTPCLGHDGRQTLMVFRPPDISDGSLLMDEGLSDIKKMPSILLTEGTDG